MGFDESIRLESEERATPNFDAGTASVPLLINHEDDALVLDSLAESSLEYLWWLRLVILRLITRTPALGSVKDKANLGLSQAVEFLGFQNFEAFAQGRTLMEIKRVLTTVLDDWQAKYGPSARMPRQLEINLKRLADVVGLSALETEVLGFGVLLHTESIVDSAGCLLGTELRGYKMERILGHLLGRRSDAVANCLQASSKLATSGLFKIDLVTNGSLLALVDMLTSSFPARMLMAMPDIRKVIEGYVRPACESALALEDIKHVQPHTEICLGLIRHALQHHTTGLNLLLYGDPGTGKTTFAQFLARQLEVALMEISPCTIDGAPISPGRRVHSYRVAQAFFKSTATVILFDECEEVLGQSELSDDDENWHHPRKSWVNNSLETNAVPTIWITNSIKGFDKAFLRRFSLCIEMPRAPENQRAKWVAQEFGDVIRAETMLNLARHDETTPAMLMQTAHVVKAVSASMSDLDADALACHVMNAALKAQGKAELHKQAGQGALLTGFDPKWVQCGVNLTELASAMAAGRSGKLCFYGPPGTGKTAFGKWLARCLGVPHIVKKASDLLGRYVGVTEKNIARAFEEARQQKAVLQFDEVDSFLQDRLKASKSWEVTQVNEMLTQMEGYDGVFIASTNLFQNLDEASLRRFDMSIKFDYLKPAAAWDLFTVVCEKLGLPRDLPSLHARVQRLEQLTPGDFEQVVRRARLLTPKSAEQVLLQLESAVQNKAAVSTRSIGFLRAA